MPSTSRNQQKFMGMVYDAKKGEKPASKEVAKAAKGMSTKSAKDFASTKHKGLPKKVEETGDKYTVKSGPNKGKRWSPSTPGPTNPDYKEIDGNLPSPPDGATAPPPGWKPEKTKTKSKKVSSIDDTSDDTDLAEGKKDLTGDGKHDFDDVQAARRIAGGQSKKAAVKAAKSDKLKEETYTINGKKVSKSEYEKEMKKAKKKIKEALELMRQAKTLIGESKKEQLASRLFETHDEMHDHEEYDDEAGMADNNLETLKRAVMGLDEMIAPGDNLPEWCQEKIAVATDMMVSVWDYLQSEEDSSQEMEIPTDDQYLLTLRERLESFKK